MASPMNPKASVASSTNKRSPQNNPKIQQQQRASTSPASRALSEAFDPMDQDQPSGNINLGQTLLGASSHSSFSDQPALSVRPASTNTISSQYTAMASTVGNQAAAAVSANNSRTTLKRLSISSGFYAGCVEVVKDLIYFWIQPSAVVQASLASRRPPAVPSNAIPMFVDYEYNYTHFYLDFGPLNIAHIYRFCRAMQTAYQNCRVSGKRIVVATSEAPNHCTNAALLVSAFLTLELGYPSAEACRPFTEYRTPGSGLPLPIVNYRDAGNGPATYWISIQDCCHILEKGIRQFQLLDLSRFDVEEYEFYEQMQNGDFNWIIPGFFLAHATPHDSPPPNLLRYHEEVNAGRIISLRPRNPRFQPLIELNNLLAYMKSERIAVRGMVRLNNKLYDRNRVLGTGIQHYELYFPDGSNPSAEIVKQFMMICDNHLPYNRLPFFHQHPECGPLVNLEPEERRSERGALAVHCKAGLGRTGTLICCWMIKNLGWTARECISWCRLMRPGSVVGPQQNWLESMESQLLAWGQSEQEQRLKAVQELAKSLNVPSTQNTGKQPRRQATGQRNSNLLTQLDRNEGTEALTETSMGMRVPVQPNKLERVAYSAVNGGASNYTATGAEKTSHYNLRNVQDYPDDDHVSNASGGSSSTPRSRNGSQSVQGGLRVGVMTRSRSRNLADSVEGENNNSNNSTMFHA